MVSHDVVIVGAGPAGAALAYELAKMGIDVLILEKGKLPRYQTCSGGISVRAANLLDFDISPVTEQLIYRAKFSYKLGNGYTKEYDKPLIHMVMRDRFDLFLIQKAQEIGVRVTDGQKVEQIQMMANHAVVVTPAYKFKARIVAGADGANSTVARAAGLMGGVDFAIGINAEVSVSDEAMARWDSTVGLDIGYVPYRQGWIFPKEAHLSIGVWGAIALTKELKPYYKRLLESQNLGNYEVTSLKGRLVSLRKSGLAIQRNNALLLGAAAGLLHPLTGEGIYYAIKSAQLAAPVIAKSLQTDVIELYDYERAVDLELMPELQAGRWLLRLFNRSPHLYFRWLKRSEHLWRAACCLVRGEKSQFRQELGLSRYLFNTIYLRARRSR